MREIDARAALALLQTGQPLVRVRVSGTLDLRKLCRPARWWRRQDETVAIPITIRDSIIEGFDAIGLMVTAPVVLDRVVAQGPLALNSCFFVAGLQARHCTFDGDVDLCWGGHNGLDCPFVLEQCRFERFVNFDDEWFKGPVRVCECTFVRGTNLLGMKGWPNQVTFDMPPTVERNTGRLDVDGTADPGAPSIN